MKRRNFFRSYFTKICTEMVTKIINVPILKNAGTTITGCMKTWLLVRLRILPVCMGRCGMILVLWFVLSLLYEIR